MRKSQAAETERVAKARRLAIGVRSGKEHIRDQSRLQLIQMGSCVVDSLHQTIDRARANRERRKCFRYAAVGYLWLVAIVLCVVMPAAKFSGNFQQAVEFSLFASCLLITARYVTTGSSVFAAVTALAEIRDMRSLGYLIDATRYGDRRTSISAVRALTSMLVDMTSSDALSMTMAQRSILYSHLTGPNRELALTLLRVLPLFHDAGALPLVEKLAAGLGAAKNDVEIRETAAALLPMLAARRDLEISDQTLLRAGNGERVNTATALRAPQYVEDHSEVSQLLRAGAADERDANE